MNSPCSRPIKSNLSLQTVSLNQVKLGLSVEPEFLTTTFSVGQSLERYKFDVYLCMLLSLSVISLKGFLLNASVPSSAEKPSL